MSNLTPNLGNSGIILSWSNLVLLGQVFHAPLLLGKIERRKLVEEKTGAKLRRNRSSES